MASPEAEAHIAAQEQLQAIAASGVAAAWDSLPNYDEESVAPFLALVVPLILAVQRRSAALTNAFLARAVGRPPVAFDVSQVIGEAIRTATPRVIEASRKGPGLSLALDATGVPPEIVYRRPFVETWSALSDHAPWVDAVAAGRARAQGTAKMDVQNTMRHTLRLVGGQDDLILGYSRVPDSNACPFCRLISGRRYLTSDLMEVHPSCACGVEPITAANRDEFSGKRSNDLAVPRGVAFHDHGELGPLVGSSDHGFTGIDQIAA